MTENSAPNNKGNKECLLPFKEDELNIYNTHMTDAEIILKYQESLPILEDDGNNSINARDLHSQLGVKKDFSNWIKDKIKNYGFEENIDYKMCSPKKASGLNGGQNKIDYLLTLSTAKELAMVQNNETLIF